MLIANNFHCVNIETIKVKTIKNVVKIILKANLILNVRIYDKECTLIPTNKFLFNLTEIWRWTADQVSGSLTL